MTNYVSKMIKNNEIIKKKKKKKRDLNIYTSKKCLKFLFSLYNLEGYKLPGNYVTKSKKNCTYFLYEPYYIKDIKNNYDFIKKARNERFSAQTYIENDKIDTIHQNDEYYLININLKTKIRKLGKDLPKKINANTIIQKIIEPCKLFDKKFFVEVFCCIKRSGEIYIYDNLLYTFYCENKKKNKKSFFEKDNKNIMSTNNYLNQLKFILPKIYNILLKEMNTLSKQKYNNYYMINKLTFMPDKDDILKLLKISNLDLFMKKNKNRMIYFREFFNQLTDFIYNDRDISLKNISYLSLSVIPLPKLDYQKTINKHEINYDDKYKINKDKEDIKILCQMKKNKKTDDLINENKLKIHLNFNYFFEFDFYIKIIVVLLIIIIFKYIFKEKQNNNERDKIFENQIKNLKNNLKSKLFMY